jgi:hypothetical protein
MNERPKRWLKIAIPAVAIPAAILLLLFVVWRVWFYYNYPYGWSHCCENGLYLALIQYAEEHGGAFPAGESSAEASLSLLYRMNPNLGAYLPGKTVPESTVLEILERGELLGPETCGWHYVEGLTRDDHGLALFWDKAGLDHNGGRLSGGGHIVWFVGCASEHIPASQWDRFLEEQQELLAQRKGASSPLKKSLNKNIVWPS